MTGSTARNVHFFLAPDWLFGSLEFYGSGALDRVREHRSHYRLAGMIPTDLEGEAAAEMVFDVSNNPCNETLKESMGWVGRSLSVGDIVTVDGVDFVCLPVGWKILR
jgi:hypothetical protein